MATNNTKENARSNSLIGQSTMSPFRSSFGRLFDNALDESFNSSFNELFNSSFNSGFNESFNSILDRFGNMGINQASVIPNFSDHSMQGLSIGSNSFVKKDGVYVLELDIGKDMIENIKIKEKNRFITINAVKIDINEDKHDNTNFKSKSSREFSQSMQLPADAVENTAYAEHSHGKLRIIVQCNNTIMQSLTQTQAQTQT